MPGAYWMSLKWLTFCSAMMMRSTPYVISTETGSRLMPPACWKYVNCVISRPSSHTSQPRPHEPVAGLAQLSSTNLMSWAWMSMPSASRLSRYCSCGSPGSGFRITWNCVCVCSRLGFSPYRASSGRTLGSTYDTRHGSGPSTRRMVAGFRVPAPTSVLTGCTIMQPRSVQYLVKASNASCMVSTLTTLNVPGLPLHRGVPAAITLSPDTAGRGLPMVKVHTALLVVCAAALLACVALAVPLLTTAGPESRDVSPAVAGPAPTSRTPATRKGGLPNCLIGSWRVVSQEETIKCYIDADPLPFTFGGGERTYEFHPDGQVVEQNAGFTMVSNHNGQKVRSVRNGQR